MSSIDESLEKFTKDLHDKWATRDKKLMEELEKFKDSLGSWVKFDIIVPHFEVNGKDFLLTVNSYLAKIKSISPIPGDPLGRHLIKLDKGYEKLIIGDSHLCGLAWGITTGILDKFNSMETEEWRNDPNPVFYAEDLAFIVGKINDKLEDSWYKKYNRGGYLDIRYKGLADESDTEYLNSIQDEVENFPGKYHNYNISEYYSEFKGKVEISCLSGSFYKYYDKDSE